MKYILLTISLIITFLASVQAANLCQFASSATATSENSQGSLAQYATGAPNAPNPAQCSTWSGYGYTWSPSNWNVKGTLTLKYNTPVFASNLTIFGDYDICFNKITLKNSQTSQTKEIFNGFEESCTITKKTDSTFLADTIILETCGWSWSSTDAVQLCGNTGNNDIIPVIETPIYIAPYIGDIDGAKSSLWFPVYSQLANFFEQNKIKSSFSFFPGTMSSNSDYINSLRIMYNSPYIELVQKGNNGNATEQIMDQLSFETQKNIILNGQNNFKSWTAANLGINNPIMPKSYNQIGARFTETTLKAAEELGFNFYIDLYVGNGLTPVKSTQTFDAIQYGISFPISGVGKDTVFKKPQDIINEINNLTRLGRQDVEILKINNTIIIPLWAHQQDFENSTIPSNLDKEKWVIFNLTFQILKNDPNVKFITPEEIYALRHQQNQSPLPQPIPNSTSALCQFASSATATSENSQGSLAQYATGAPNAPNPAQCSTWSGYGYTWSPSNWNVKGTLTLKYNTPVFASNLTIFGDYDICFNKITLKNSQTSQTKEIFNGFEESCTITKKTDSTFLADTIILETCGWSWSSTDAVQLCGNTGNNDIPPNPDPNPTEIEVCTWKNCKKGAISVSVDDGFTACMSNLESNGFRGTYFLSGTATYSSSKWQIFSNAFNKGHELSTHTRSHWCVDILQSQYTSEVENNIIDIISHTSAKRQDLITHAYPCGLTTSAIQNLLETNTNWNFLSARGYHINDFEDETPSNFFELKSFNTPYYHNPPLAPPNYFDVVDQAESEGKWANLVFHNECSDDGLINTLPSKNLWVDTIGNVVKYISLRDNAQITDFALATNQITFKILTDQKFQSIIYKQDLTLSINIPAGKTVVSVTSNGQNIPYQILNTNNIIFNVLFPISDNIVINMQ